MRPVILTEGFSLADFPHAISLMELIQQVTLCPHLQGLQGLCLPFHVRLDAVCDLPCKSSEGRRLNGRGVWVASALGFGFGR